MTRRFAFGGFVALLLAATASLAAAPSIPPDIDGPLDDGDGTYTLTWNASTGTVTAYKLEENSVEIYAGSNRAFKVTGRSGTKTYRVRACNNAECSAYGGTITTIAQTSASTPPSVLAMPTISQTLIDASSRTGTTDGSFRVDETGSATYSIPIATVPGTAGVAPKLSLEYSSGRRASTVVGYGWAIGGLSGIGRCRQTLAQDGQALPIQWNTSDRLCLDGQRLILTAGSYLASGSEYRTEIDGFTVVRALGGTAGNPSYFEVERKDGSFSYYGLVPGIGSQTDAKQNEAGGNTFSWALKHFQDSAGNGIWFIYANDADGQRISEVRYAYGASVLPGQHNARVTFTYAAGRPDPISAYVAGTEFAQKMRLIGITSFNGAAAVRQYNLAYLNTTTNLNKLSRLTSIQECSDATSAICLPATTFNWAADYSGYSTVASGSFNFTPANDKFVKEFRPADINGDGYTDFLWLELDQDGLNFDHKLKYALSDGTTLHQAAFSNAVSVNYSDGYQNTVKLEAIDYNLDGRTDAAVYNENSQSWRVYLAEPFDTGAGGVDWLLNSTPAASLTGVTPASSGQFSDVNSDGLVDRAGTLTVNQLEKDPAQLPSSAKPYRFGSPVAWTWPVDPVNGDPSGGRFVDADFNGDGRSDAILDKYELFCDPLLGCAFIWGRAGVSTGASQVVPFGDAPDGENWDLGDFNGDGLTDAVAGTQLRISTGTGFAVSAANVSAGQNAKSQTDFNGDGYPDIVYHDETAARVKVQLWDPLTKVFATAIDVITTNGNSNESHLFIDVNSDGVNDYLHFKKDKLTTYLANGSNQARNVITSVTNGIGANTAITYGSLANSNHYSRLTLGTIPGPVSFEFDSVVYNFIGPTLDVAGFYTALNSGFDVPGNDHTLGKRCAAPSGECPVLELHGPINIVTAVEGTAPRASASPGAVNTTAKSKISYYYGEAKAQASGRGFLGFHSLATIDEQTGVKTITRYRQDFPFTGMPMHTEVLTPSGAKLREGDTTWALQNWTGSAATTVAPHRPSTAQSIEKSYALANNGTTQGGLLSRTVTTTDQDAYGNAPTITTDIEDGVGGLVNRKVLTNTYGSTAFDQRFGRLSRTVVEHTRGAITKTRTSSFTYFATGGNTDGLLQTETIEPDNASYAVTTTYQRDGFGNITHATKSAAGLTPRTTRSVYDTVGRYVNETFNALNQRTQFVVVGTRNALGQPTEIDDIANLRTSIRYDAFGRKYLERSPTGAYKTTLLATASASCPAGSTYMVTTTGADGSRASECYDAIARATRKIVLAFDGTESWTDVEYDALGREKNISAPRVQGASADYWQVTSYDLLGRPTRVDLPVVAGSPPNFVTSLYNGLSVTIANALGHGRTETKNVLGELVRVVDQLLGQIDYEYRADGHLLSATTRRSAGDPAPIVVAMSYDDLGRKTGMSDPDKGAWVYEYTFFDELKKQTDAKLQTSEFTYDELGRRQTRIDKLAGGTVEDTTTWTWASTGSAIGQLQSVSQTGFSESYSYDLLGRPITVATTIGAASFTRSTQYDAVGRVWREFDAVHAVSGSSGTQPFYNARGYLSQVIDLASGEEAYRVQTQNARGQVTTAFIGFLTAASYGYDPATGRMLTQLAQVGSSQPTQQLTYTWDVIGNLKSRRNQRSGQDLQEAFCYDALNRVVKALVAALTADCLSPTTAYDNLGNITWKAGVGGYSYGTSSVRPHAVVSIDTGTAIETYSYDANGSAISDSTGRAFTYAIFDKPTRITKGAVTIDFAYGPERDFYKRIDAETGLPSMTTFFLGNVERQRIGLATFWKRTLPGGGLFTLTVNSSNAPVSNEQTYVLKEHLGSTDVILDDFGFTVQQFGFDPWGQRRDATTWAALTGTDLTDFDASRTKKGFTGHEMLDKVGIIHMGGRIYDPRIARFLQADPIVQSSTDTQLFNRYSYTRNNPLNATDPSGFMSFGEIWDFAFGFVFVAVAGFMCGPGAPICAGVAAFVWARHLGASWTQSIIAGVSAGAFTWAGGQLGGLADGAGGFSGEVIGGVIAMGVLGGVTSVLQGGDFGSGFLSSAVGFGIGARLGGARALTKVIVGAVVGGTLSEITGGKFANGALTGAMGAAIGSALDKGGEAARGEFEEVIVAGGYTTPQNIVVPAKGGALTFPDMEAYRRWQNLPANRWTKWFRPKWWINGALREEIGRVANDPDFRAQADAVVKDQKLFGRELRALRVYEAGGKYYLYAIGEPNPSTLGITNLPPIDPNLGRWVFDWHHHPGGSAMASPHDLKMSWRYRGPSALEYDGQTLIYQGACRWFSPCGSAP